MPGTICLSPTFSGLCPSFFIDAVPPPLASPTIVKENKYLFFNVLQSQKSSN
jgi:hypothetical protein